jgi:hypothetical protein
LLLFALTGPALPADLIGRASIIDGDTIEIHGHPHSPLGHRRT